MRELLKRLTELRDSARLSCATRHPDPGNEAYAMGFLQGRHLGIEDAITTVQTWLDDADRRKDEL